MLIVCPNISLSATLLTEIVDSCQASLVPVDNGGCSVILLTGGSSRRMGNDKAGLTFGNRTLLTFQLEQIPSKIPIVVVGESIDGWPEVTCTREDPPYSGPVAAVASGLELITTPLVLLLAVDTPFAFPQLLRFELGSNSQALIPRDHDGKAQYLAGLYRSDSLRSALGQLGSPKDKSMRELTSHLQSIDYHELTPKDVNNFMDLDTREDLAAARALLASRPKVVP